MFLSVGTEATPEVDFSEVIMFDDRAVRGKLFANFPVYVFSKA
jgi:hypothetical protein